MAVTLNNVFAVPDVLDAQRYHVRFANVPGASGKSNLLTVLHSTLTQGPQGFAQVQVKMWGWTRNFAGQRQDQATFGLQFYEVAGGPITKIFETWHGLIWNKKTFRGSPSKQYQTEIRAELLDTRGKVALAWIGKGVWPMTVTAPPHTPEASSAALVDVQFSVDLWERANV